MATWKSRENFFRKTSNRTSCTVLRKQTNAHVIINKKVYGTKQNSPAQYEATSFLLRDTRITFVNVKSKVNAKASETHFVCNRNHGHLL